MASVIAEISTVLHKSFTGKWKSASSYSPKKFTRQKKKKKKGGGLAKKTGESGTLLFCHCFLKDSATFPIGYRWYGFLYLYFKISFSGPVLTKNVSKAGPRYLHGEIFTLKK